MRRVLPWIVVLLAASWVVPACAQRESSPTVLLKTAETDRSSGTPAAELERRGDEARALKNLVGAANYYREAIEKTRFRPQKAALFNKLGITALLLQRYPEAQKLFEHAVGMDKKLAEAYNNLGASLYLQKKYGKAIGQYHRALKLSDESSFHSNLGAAYFMERKFGPATDEYRRAFELDPGIFDRTSQTGIAAQLSSPENRAEYSFMLARMFAASGDVERSLHYLRRAMEDGYTGIKSVYKDEGFAALRRDPRFEALMKNPPVAIPE